MIDQFVDFVIRPPRAECNPDQYLWETDFTLAGKSYKRQDLEVKMAVQYMRRVRQRKAKFAIMDLNCLQVAPKSFIPALFGHANEDKFIQPHHSDLIFKHYAGDKSIIKFDSDHNSSQPQFYYDSFSMFFHNVLRPPQNSVSYPSKYEKHFDLANLKISSRVDEDDMGEGVRLAGHDITQLQECCSLTSSTRESRGRCLSLGGSDDEPAKNDYQMALNAIATPRRSFPCRSIKVSSEDKKKEEEKKVQSTPIKSRRDKFDKFEAMSQRLRLCLLGGASHERHQSS